MKEPMVISLRWVGREAAKGTVLYGCIYPYSKVNK